MGRGGDRGKPGGGETILDAFLSRRGPAQRRHLAICQREANRGLLRNFSCRAPLRRATARTRRLNGLLHGCFAVLVSAAGNCCFNWGVYVPLVPAAQAAGTKNGNSTQRLDWLRIFVVRGALSARRWRRQSAYSVPSTRGLTRGANDWQAKRRARRREADEETSERPGAICAGTRIECRSCVVIAEKHGAPPHGATQREVCGYPAGWRDPHTALALKPCSGHAAADLP